MIQNINTYNGQNAQIGNLVYDRVEVEDKTFLVNIGNQTIYKIMGYENKAENEIKIAKVTKPETAEKVFIEALIKQKKLSIKKIPTIESILESE